MANAKRVRIRVINPPEGCREHTSLERARRYVSRGVARWVLGSIEFVQHPGGIQSPNMPAAVSMITDSGHEGFTRYPMPSPGNTTAKFPALARRGAGLAA